MKNLGDLLTAKYNIKNKNKYKSNENSGGD